MAQAARTQEGISVNRKSPGLKRRTVQSPGRCTEYGHRVASRLSDNLLEAERGSVAFKRAGDFLKNLRCALLRLVSATTPCGPPSLLKNSFPLRIGIPVGSRC
jgi:hypothetical protein